MKQVVRCLGCDKVVGLYKSYRVNLTETPIINGMVMPETKRKGKICPECNEAAGYKPKRSKSHEPKKS